MVSILFGILMIFVAAIVVIMILYKITEFFKIEIDMSWLKELIPDPFGLIPEKIVVDLGAPIRSWLDGLVSSLKDAMITLFNIITTPFRWMRNFFEGVLPPTLGSYASIIALMVIAGVVLLVAYLIIKMVRD